MGDRYLGEIRLFPYVNGQPPNGWIECNGQILNIKQYQALFSLLQTTYGGDGKTTFALPDLRGRAIAGIGAIVDNTRIAPVGAGLGLGGSGGSEAVALTGTQIPAHNHLITADTGNATSSLVSTSSIPATSVKPASIVGGLPAPNLYGPPTVGVHGPLHDPFHGGDGGPGLGLGGESGDLVSADEDIVNLHLGGGGPPRGTTTLQALNSASLENAGGNAAHENRQPFLPMMYCIAVDQAIYPPRD